MISENKYTSEQMAPLLPEFPFASADARFIGNPIDFVVFDANYFSVLCGPGEPFLMIMKSGGTMDT